MTVRETRPRDAPRRQLFTAGREILLGAPRLSVHDGFAFALAESHPGCILVTGDAPLRAAAESSDIETHGIPWVRDELHPYKRSADTKLVSALPLLSKDSAVRLQRNELAAPLKPYGDR